ncbi:hypothetical protein SARC_13592 [Sphaeroforma arctica JP610]|uniref:Uncharacterized protein n=1 Tax=Sphaeroforma arctica JP610 TaxID=667725 RepID=A0A0L0FAR7_9EUKA|nr:hypothetical protein SARC_13592 [Sphaeroforma arctica JP610]KNC73850.1 hypothetical protein SARC_13592 [Sphaeroforma arctica JP610]|eukprot:XP_014147752.1 hypothetical protein SARC_13592 [Sphaeroforma arctica JP610]
MQTRMDWGHYTTTPIVDAGYMECLAHMGRFEEAMTMFASCSRALGESNSSEIKDEMNFFQYRSQSTLHLVREYSDNPELQSIAGQLESTLFVDNWQRHKGSVTESTHSWRYKFGSHPHHRTFWDTQAQKWSKTPAEGAMDEAAGVGDEESIPRTGFKTPLQEFVYTGGVNDGERHEDSETGVRPRVDVHDDLQWDIQDTDITDLPLCGDTHGAMASATHHNIHSHTNTDSDARATALLTIVRAHKPTAIPQRTKIRDIKYKPYSRRVLAQNPNVDGRAHSRRVEKSEQQERAELELAGEYAKWDQRQPRQARHIRTKGKDYGMLREITNLWMDGDRPGKMAGERKGTIGLGGAQFVEKMRTKFAETMGTILERDGVGESLDDLAGVDAEEKTTSSENKWRAKNLDGSSMRRKGSIGDGDKIEHLKFESKKKWAKNEDNEKGRRTKNEIEKKNHDKRGKGFSNARRTTRRGGGLERDREETL